MTELQNQVKRIQEKIQQLLKQQLILRKENDKLKQDLKAAQAGSLNQAAHIDQLIQQAEILKLSKQDMDGTEKKAFEKRLNGYIKEIDRCITLLKE
jgi:hypothetical protein